MMSGTYNALYILPRCLYTNERPTFIYSLATVIIGVNINMNKKNMESINNWENLLRTAAIELKTIKLLRGKK